MSMRKIIIYHYQFTDDNTTYHIDIKVHRSYRFRMVIKHDHISVTTPYLLNENQLLKLLKLRLEAEQKRQAKQSGIVGDHVFVFGSLLPIEQLVTAGGTLEAELKTLLENYLTTAVSKYCHLLELPPHFTIKIKDMRSRFGSMSKKTNNLSFALHLIHYHPDLIDYVVIHELTHAKVMNHSASFYQELAKYYPAYRRAEIRLRKGVYHND